MQTSSFAIFRYNARNIVSHFEIQRFCRRDEEIIWIKKEEDELNEIFLNRQSQNLFRVFLVIITIHCNYTYLVDING